MLLKEIESYYRSLNFQNKASLSFKRNKLKEFLHLYLLDFIYKHENYQKLIFYGGTCLKHCFGLPRLSEDLDFEYLEGDFPFELLQKDLKNHFKAKLSYNDITIKQQKFRTYIRFPLLKQLNIASQSESDFLHLKIEINVTSHSKETYNTEKHPFFAQQHSFFINRYDLETLMASKINAILNRTWVKKHKERSSVSDAKGRDYFDLIWYMQKNIIPNISFTQHKTAKDLWQKISEKVRSLKSSSIENDLVDFLPNPHEAKDFAKNIHESYKMLLKNYMG